MSREKGEKYYLIGISLYRIETLWEGFWTIMGEGRLQFENKNCIKLSGSDWNG